MRYTTIIDITDLPIWRNTNVLRLYYFACMKCGYHDNDRDILQISIRKLSYLLDMSISAVRHSLKVLHAAGLIIPVQESTYRVIKWVDNQEISKRKSKRELQLQVESMTREQQRQQQEQLEQEQKKIIEKERKQRQQRGESVLDMRIRNARLALAAGDEYAQARLNKLLKQKENECK